MKITLDGSVPKNILKEIGQEHYCAHPSTVEEIANEVKGDFSKVRQVVNQLIEEKKLELI